MLCSTVLPTIGTRQTLERAIVSAVEQDLSADQHEVIVVNNSGKPLGEPAWLGLPKVRVIHTNYYERSIASNVGVSVAHGKYVNILHDDDYLLPGALPALLAIAEQAGSVWTYGAYDQVDNDGAYIRTDSPDVHGNIFALLVAGECLHLSTSVILRDAFLRVGGFDPTVTIVDDRDLEARLAMIGTFTGTRQIVARLRVGEQGSTADWSKTKVEFRYFLEKTLDLPGALDRARDSAQDDPFLRGRVCRAYLRSAAVNLLRGKLGPAAQRISGAARIAGPYSTSEIFRRGLRDTMAGRQV